MADEDIHDGLQDEPWEERTLHLLYNSKIDQGYIAFHAVYWPAMLMSAGLTLPKMVFGHGFLTKPQTKNGVDSFGGLGATLIDSLDTLYIMGLDEQFQRAREWVANSLDFNKNYDASVFETTIRVVGGLLSTYDLSGDKIFLEKAKDIADRLLPAWDTQSGIPYNIINLAHGNAHNPGWTGGDSILADSATEQVEFIALSQRTGDPKYQQKVENVIAQLNKTFPADGFFPSILIRTEGLNHTRPLLLGPWGTGYQQDGGRGRGRGRGRDIQNPTHQSGFDPRAQDSRSDMQDAGRIDHALRIAHPIIEAGYDASVREPDRLYEAIERMTRVLQGQQIDEAGPSSIPLRTYNRRRRVDDR